MSFPSNQRNNTRYFLLLSLLIPALILGSCGSKAGPEQAAGTPPPAPEIPVIAVMEQSAITFNEYSAAIEGKVNVDIRPQVDGYLDKIFVDEGAYVKAGQPLFKINDRIYQEQLNTANAAMESAKANLRTAQIEVNKIKPLVQNKVVSEVQLSTAEANYSQAQAAVSQAKSTIASAKINIGFTLIKAPISGYIGKIPKRVGNLVSKGDQEPMTTLSDTKEVYAYFSMSEPAFLQFNAQVKGNTMAEKLKRLPPVSLVLADGTTYPQKGRIQIVDGQFDKSTGSISLRAVFPNPQGLLRSGNTGKIRLEEQHEQVVMVPKAATMDVQDKIFVYFVGPKNKLERRAITISGKSGNNYLIKDGLKKGETIVYSGLDGLAEEAEIKPKPLNADSVYRAQ
ncbi:efflux RND transporter periplasmic adaptor subunit [Pedobacter gandavensis]|uniref:Efflux RND transporter periplasmic adaptor subunit n=1 Tax=Pedobacter gandavensis TaxID=2679963 RepID=A0ABR6ETZ3_9SPHI|nr:efflux RND transporter periplasmic adaptor subunit [Pedobacter gandavensis]MBB2148735.1 efflux RND transporter periplasmic adaptor subunit [Pedobacter gandavensis]